MLRSLKDIKGYQLQAINGDIGRCKDFLFDDRFWTIRYMVANTHKWLPGGRKILVSPVSLKSPDVEQNFIPVALTLDEIKNSPPLDEHEPVSAQYEREFFNYYGYGYYWMGSGIWGTYGTPNSLLNPQTGPILNDAQADSGAKAKNSGERHLRSSNEVEGYTISAIDASIGHVEDFIVDDESWSIAYLEVDTRNWLPGGKKVLVEPGQIESVDWSARSVKVTLTAEQIRQRPECDLEELNENPASQKDVLEHSLD